MRITYYRTASGREPAKEYIYSLQQASLEIILKDLELLSELGFDAPVVTRKLKDKLWEIKTGSGRQQRIFYVTIAGPELVLLHACKKQKQGSQKEDVDLAFKRMKEVLS